jgi:hypothetical protein
VALKPEGVMQSSAVLGRFLSQAALPMEGTWCFRYFSKADLVI